MKLKIEFSAKLSRADANWAFDLTKTHMENVYENSGYGWDDEDKMRELTEQGARFLLVREASEGPSAGRLVAFAHFRFTVQGEVMDIMAGEPCLYLWDLQVEKTCQRRGLGRHMITLLELIARREKMSYLSLPIQNMDNRSMDWITKIRGFKPDFELTNLVGFDPETEGFTVMSKMLTFTARRSDRNAGADVTPIKVSEGKRFTQSQSPVSIMDLEEQGLTGGLALEKEFMQVAGPAESLELTGLTEKDVIDGLRILFKEKNGRDVTEDEVQQWLAAVCEADAGNSCTATRAQE